jgi:hypothetical protein
LKASRDQLSTNLNFLGGGNVIHSANNPNSDQATTHSVVQMKALINPLQYHRVIEPLILIVRPDIHQPWLPCPTPSVTLRYWMSSVSADRMAPRRRMKLNLPPSDVTPLAEPSGHRDTQLPVFIGLILRFMVLSRFLRAHYGYDGHGHHFETNELLFVSLMMSASGCVSLTLGQQVGGLGGDLGAKRQPHPTLWM